MHFSLRTALVMLASASIAAGACGGNVVVDGNPAGTGGMGGTTAASPTTTGFGASTTTTTFSFGVGAGTTNDATSTSVVTSTTATGTGGASTGACTQGVDEKIFSGLTFFPDIEVPCVMATPGNTPATMACIQAKTGLSNGCMACIGADLQCGVTNCLNVCATNQGSPMCTTCRRTSCEAAFIACSGQPHEPGSLTCASVLGVGPKGTLWQQGLAAADFATDAAESTYQAFGACACNGACSGACSPNYCNGQMASVNCVSCVFMACGAQMAKCMAN
jgi:hypothetical protein